jgi:glycosyltransferase involved in cell wall biosynthesis
MNKKLRPLVSIIMPAFNAEKYIKESIISMIQQTYNNFELIICDDASTDGTNEIIRNFAKLDLRIRSLRNKKNQGISNTLNSCIKRSTGDFIARMNADDIMFKNRINDQVQYLMKNNEIYIIGGGVDLINSNGVLIKSRSYPKSNEDINKKLFYYNPFCHPCLMFRREVFAAVGVYNSKFDGAEDLDFIGRVLSKFKGANLDQTILKYRIHQNSISSIQASKQELLTFYIR